MSAVESLPSLTYNTLTSDPSSPLNLWAVDAASLTLTEPTCWISSPALNPALLPAGVPGSTSTTTTFPLSPSTTWTPHQRRRAAAERRRDESIAPFPIDVPRVGVSSFLNKLSTVLASRPYARWSKRCAAAEPVGAAEGPLVVQLVRGAPGPSAAAVGRPSISFVSLLAARALVLLLPCRRRVAVRLPVAVERGLCGASVAALPSSSCCDEATHQFCCSPCCVCQWSKQCKKCSKPSQRLTNAVQ